MKLLIGADPELFVLKDGKPISAFGMIKGTKKEPFPVDKGAVQVDGMALEFNIDPVGDYKSFDTNINTVLAELRKMVPPEYQFDFEATANFDREYMEALPEEAKILGCDPDYNAYSSEQNPPPKAHPTLRAAGGHVHLGWGEGFKPDDPVHMAACARVVRQLDFYLGVPSVLMDTNTMRRTMYGQAGAFRPKSYGVEYRTLSNFWVNKPEYRKWVFTQCHLAVSSLIKKNDIHAKYGRVAQNCINDSHTKYATDIIRSIPGIYKDLPIKI